MKHDILDYRIQKNNRYQLLETVECISNDSLVMEGGSFVGNAIHKFVTRALMMLLDDVTGELSGMIAVLPLLYKNIYEIHVSNKNFESLMATTTIVDKKELNKVRQALITDISDIVNAIVLAIPIPIIDAAGIAFFNMLEGLIIGRGSGFITEKLDKYQTDNPKMAKLFQIVAYPFGGNVIYMGLKNIAEINDMVNSIESGSRSTLPITENHMFQRWQVLSGIN